MRAHGGRRLAHKAHTASGETLAVLGIDVGGTAAKAAVIEASLDARGRVAAVKPREAGQVKAQRSEWKGDDAFARDYQRIVEMLGDLACRFLGRRHVQAIGLGLPGTVDSNRGVCLHAPALPGLNHHPIERDLRRRLGLPVFVGNDVNCAALGELRAGCGRGRNSLFMITLGTGIGGGIAINGELWFGAHEKSAEIGHTVLERDGPQCACGNHGCFEQLAGLRGIVSRARRAVKSGRSTILPDLEQEHEEDVPRLISQAAAKGDRLAKDILQETGVYVGLALTNAICLIDPEIVVVGGGIAEAGKILFDAIRATVRERGIVSEYDVRNIVRPGLGPFSGIYGSAIMAAERLG